MCSHDVLQHKYQNHSPLTHQQYRAAGVHWLALGRRGGEPVVQQNKAHKKLGRGRPHLINSWAQLQLDAPLNKILDCHWRGPAHNMTDRKGVDNRSLRLIYENHDNETRLHGSGPRTLSRPLQVERWEREKGEEGHMESTFLRCAQVRPEPDVTTSDKTNRGRKRKHTRTTITVWKWKQGKSK